MKPKKCKLKMLIAIDLDLKKYSQNMEFEHCSEWGRTLKSKTTDAIIKLA